MIEKLGCATDDIRVQVSGQVFHKHELLITSCLCSYAIEMNWKEVRDIRIILDVPFSQTTISRFRLRRLSELWGSLREVVDAFDEAERGTILAMADEINERIDNNEQ